MGSIAQSDSSVVVQQQWQQHVAREHQMVSLKLASLQTHWSRWQLAHQQPVWLFQQQHVLVAGAALLLSTTGGTGIMKGLRMAAPDSSTRSLHRTLLLAAALRTATAAQATGVCPDTVQLPAAGLPGLVWTRGSEQAAAEAAATAAAAAAAAEPGMVAPHIHI